MKSIHIEKTTIAITNPSEIQQSIMKIKFIGIEKTTIVIAESIKKFNTHDENIIDMY